MALPRTHQAMRPLGVAIPSATLAAQVEYNSGASNGDPGHGSTGRQVLKGVTSSCPAISVVETCSGTAACLVTPIGEKCDLCGKLARAPW